MSRARSTREGGCWPTGEQALLLRAILVPGPDALVAWARWKHAVDLDRLDAASVRLLPLVYRRLERDGVRDALMGRLKGLYRHTWCANQLRLRDAAVVLRRLGERGIETMLLKGAALALLYYRDAGVRPMDDVDVLVPTDRAELAVEVLRQLGWTPRYQVTARHVEVGHGVDFADTQAQRLDLHWHLLSASCWPSADATFWEHAQRATLHGVEVSVLHPTEQLFHVCAHGVKWESLAPLRWIADAAAILARAEAEIDWDRLGRQAEQHRLTLPIREALGYLRDALGLPVPIVVLEQLRGARISPGERWEQHLRTRSPSALVGRLPELWLRYCRQRREREQNSVGFVRYVQIVLGCDSLWGLGRRVLLRHRWRRHAHGVSREYTRAVNRAALP